MRRSPSTKLLKLQIAYGSTGNPCDEPCNRCLNEALSGERTAARTSATAALCSYAHSRYKSCENCLIGLSPVGFNWAAVYTMLD